MFALLLVSCQTYRPAPLTHAAVEDALRPPDAEVLRARAAELSHPVLRPVELDPREGLDADTVGVLAVLLNPSLRAVRDRRALADAQVLDAGLLPNPRLGYDFEALTGGDTAGKVDAFGLKLDWEMTSLISRAARVDSATARREAVDLDIAWAEWGVALAARADVWRLAALTRELAVAEEDVRGARGQFDLVEGAVSEGTATQDDLAAARAARARSESRREDLAARAESTRLDLRRLLGLAPDAPVRLKTGLEPPGSFEPPPIGELLADLETRRLDLVALRAGYDSQEAAVRAAVLAQFPRIDIGLTHGRDIENVDTTGFGVELELPILSHHEGRVAREKATRQVLFDEYVDRVHRARLDVAAAVARIRHLDRAIALARQTDRERTAHAERLRGARADGRVGAREAYAAENARADGRIALWRLRGESAGAFVALEAASGRVLTGAAGGGEEER